MTVKLLSKNVLYIAWIFALLATVSSLFLSNVLNWAPCILCWYQRIFLFPLVIILGAGIIKKVSHLEYIVLPMTGLGGLIALYHTLLQFGVIPERLSPCTEGISCLTAYHIGLNFLTVPLLSFLAFLVISICMIIYRRENHE